MPCGETAAVNLSTRDVLPICRMHNFPAYKCKLNLGLSRQQIKQQKPEHNSVRMRNSVIPWAVFSLPEDAAATNLMMFGCPLNFFCVGS